MSFRRPKITAATTNSRLEHVLFAGLAVNPGIGCGTYKDFDEFEDHVWKDAEADEVFGLPPTDANIAAANDCLKSTEVDYRQAKQAMRQMEDTFSIKRILTEASAESIVAAINRNKGPLIKEYNDRFRDQLINEPGDAMKITELTVEAIDSTRGKEQQVAITLKLDKICSMASAYARQEGTKPENSKITRALVATTRVAACKVLGEEKTIRMMLSYEAEEASVLVTMRKVRGGKLAAATSAVLSFLRMVGVLPLRIPYADLGPDIVNLLR